MFEHGVGRIGDALAALVAALDPDAFTAQTASAVWAGLDRVERLAAAGKTVLACRAAQAAGGTDEGRRTGQSAVDELARRAGTSVGAVRDSVTTSQRLVDLPILDSALRAGELSTAQAQLIASAATADPSAQERLVALAPRVSLPELRDECARVRAAADPDPEARNARLRAGRRLRRYTDPEGAWNLSARGTPQAGALFNAALDSIIEECFAAARAAGRREAYEAHAFDALMVMAQRAIDPEVSPTTDPGPAAGGVGGGDASKLDARTGDQPDGAGGGSSAPDARPGNERLVEPDTSGPGNDSPWSSGATPATDPPADEPAEPVVPASLRRRGHNPRHMALLRVDLEALSRGSIQGEELCEIAGVGPVPVDVARGLLGDAVLKLVITRGSTCST
jgi:hypothetical protein